MEFPIKIDFNLPDKPENMGSSHKFDNEKELDVWMEERKKDFLKEVTVKGNRLIFTKANGESGYALIFEGLPDDYQN